MKLVGVLSFAIVAITAASIGEARRNPYGFPSCNEIPSFGSEVRSCVYICRDERGIPIYSNYKNGLPCRTWGFRGHCREGRCRPSWHPSPTGCDNTYKKEGYATSCTFNCTTNYISRNMAYHHGTPCLTLTEQGRPYNGAGLCKHGKCMNGDELSLREEKEAYPQQLHRCPDKENYSRMVLTSCYYFCNMTGNWFYGHFNSNYSSSCHLLDPAMPNRLGWCCNGTCIREAHCGVGGNSISE
ncbi:hypothetical protein MTO96_023157 [Rhipicephalus appendiculatus]|uniref:Basic tail secreted protein n=1 Tax=Rhipicephalus appendiculatus TaxID=34631 RepID=A0A131YSE4_RHIAP